VRCSGRRCGGTEHCLSSRQSEYANREDAGELKRDIADVDDLVRRIARHLKRCVRSEAMHLSIEMPFTPASTDQYDFLAVVAMRWGRAAGY
jgi:hypothetical protein